MKKGMIRKIIVISGKSRKHNTKKFIL